MVLPVQVLLPSKAFQLRLEPCFLSNLLKWMAKTKPRVTYQTCWTEQQCAFRLYLLRSLAQASLLFHLQLFTCFHSSSAVFSQEDCSSPVFFLSALRCRQ